MTANFSGSGHLRPVVSAAWAQRAFSACQQYWYCGSVQMSVSSCTLFQSSKTVVNGRTVGTTYVSANYATCTPVYALKAEEFVEGMLGVLMATGDQVVVDPYPQIGSSLSNPGYGAFGGSPSSGLSSGATAGIIIGCIFVGVCMGVVKARFRK
jgi:hypothetical protein